MIDSSTQWADTWLGKTARFFPVHLHQQGYNLSTYIILFGLEERVPHHQAGPQANPQSLQDHDASGD